MRRNIPSAEALQNGSLEARALPTVIVCVHRVVIAAQPIQQRRLWCRFIGMYSIWLARGHLNSRLARALRTSVAALAHAECRAGHFDVDSSSLDIYQFMLLLGDHSTSFVVRPNNLAMYLEV
ncbi:hypothetical protein RRF57_009398 [Xylaria bambusicola]|uniref:Uncharacterized protein n=1 Tax=Xylaria bambusicola TaxID=326684 RepID=A0AAN7UJK3_9PEZI